MPSQSYRALQKVAQSRKVRGKLREVADRMAARADVVADGQGVEADIVREDGTRPKGRSYSRVSAEPRAGSRTSTTDLRSVLDAAARLR